MAFTTKNYTGAVGRRREAVARVRLYSAPNTKLVMNGVEAKKGDVIVNGKPINEYFNYFAYAPTYNKILVETGVAGKYIISIKVAGGGLSGQVDAAVMGIARALDKIDPEQFHKKLRDSGYLTRDPRTRERRKVGNAGKARRKKSSPKR